MSSCEIQLCSCIADTHTYSGYYSELSPVQSNPALCCRIERFCEEAGYARELTYIIPEAIPTQTANYSISNTSNP